MKTYRVRVSPTSKSGMDFELYEDNRMVCLLKGIGSVDAVMIKDALQNSDNNK